MSVLIQRMVRPSIEIKIKLQKERNCTKVGICITYQRKKSCESEIISIESSERIFLCSVHCCRLSISFHLNKHDLTYLPFGNIIFIAQLMFFFVCAITVEITRSEFNIIFISQIHQITITFCFTYFSFVCRVQYRYETCDYTLVLYEGN